MAPGDTVRNREYTIPPDFITEKGSFRQNKRFVALVKMYISSKEEPGGHHSPTHSEASPDEGEAG